MKRRGRFATFEFRNIHYTKIIAATIITFLSISLSAQTAVNDSVSTHIESAITINPTDNDSGCSTYNVNITSAPQHGTTSSIAVNGSFTYTPHSGFTGRDSLQYSITCNGNSDIAKVFILVMPFPDNVQTLSCVSTPTASQWAIQQGNSSTLTAHLYAQPLAGDIDNDGDIEVLAPGFSGFGQEASSIVIYNSHLVVETTIATPTMYTWSSYPFAIADVDADGIAEIYLYSMNGVLQCYNYDGSIVSTKWTSSYINSSVRVPSLIIADVNADGVPDILALDKIFNAITGELELSLPSTIGGVTLSVPQGPNMPVFADMDNDGLLEVAGGNTVIKVNITNPHGTIGNNAFIWKTISGTNIGDGLTSVADIDLDGYMDVVVIKIGLMYVWKPYSGPNSVSTLIGSYSYSGNINTGGSRALVADLNNDGYPEIAWTNSLIMRACRYNPTTQSIVLFWQLSTTDASGVTTMTVFDFNQDGSAEIVYRDETNLRIINGNTGSNISTFACPSPTSFEYPIVVDLDQNGEADIVVSTSTGNYSTASTTPARIVSFVSPSSTRWAPARHVWNQFGYNVVHINDDLTVPQYQFNPVTPLVDPNTPSVVRRPFNNFLQQATSIDQYGRPFFTLPDATIVEDSTSVYSSCDSIRISIYYKNEGDNVLATPYKITLYKDVYRGTVIRTVTVNSNLYPDSSGRISFSFNSADLIPFQPIANFVFALNDGGTGIAQNGNQQTECDTTDNILTLLYPGFTNSNLATCNDTTIFVGDTAFLYAMGADFYQWNPNPTLSATNLSNPTATPTTTTTYYVTGYSAGGNMVYNGDFSAGNNGFISHYTYSPSVAGFGYYTVATDVTGWWNSCGGNGLFMMVDGSQTANSIVWQETVNVISNTLYAFSAMVSTLWASATNPALLQFSINNIPLGNIFNADTQMCNWQQFYELWNSGTATQATITILNQNTNWEGNDFGLDDIQFAALCESFDSVTVTVTEPIDTLYYTDSICLNIPYLQNGFDTLFAAPGHYTLTRFDNSYPRDSLIEVDMTVFPNYQINLTDIVCQGEPYTENGFDIPADSTQVPGTIIRRQLTFASTGGCDSILKLELAVQPVYNIEITKVACNFYTWNSETYYDDGDYTQYFNSVDGCDSTVTVHLSIIDADIEIISLTEDFCEEYFSILTANSTIDDIRWSTGETSDTITVRRPGNYSVSISLANCNAEDAITIPPCDFNLYLPNTITPTNEDGLNDYFMLPLNETPQITEAEIDIYDRWGKLVFTSKDIYFKWDGNVNGVILSNTVFNYRLLVRTQMGKPMLFKGSITVL